MKKHLYQLKKPLFNTDIYADEKNRVLLTENMIILYQRIFINNKKKFFKLILQLSSNYSSSKRIETNVKKRSTNQHNYKIQHWISDKHFNFSDPGDSFSKANLWAL